MGLDMYLEGHKFFMHNKREKEEGFEVREKVLDIGYWRKHPDLHGYIVKHFAKGEDHCQPIDLDEAALKKILKASEAGKLPTTSGFFFGQSMPEDKEDTRKILERALAWLVDESDGTLKSVVYRASW